MVWACILKELSSREVTGKCPSRCCPSISLLRSQWTVTPGDGIGTIGRLLRVLGVCVRARQWLGHHTPTAGGLGSISGWGAGMQHASPCARACVRTHARSHTHTHTHTHTDVSTLMKPCTLKPGMGLCSITHCPLDPSISINSWFQQSVLNLYC